MSDNDLIQKGQDDLIRRGDALKAIRLGDTVTKIQARIAAIPAVDADPVCTDCGGSGITYQTERRCACQPSIPAVQPTVKPLVWVKTLDGGETCLTDERYSISYWEGEKLFVDRYTTMRRHHTIEAAKATAQADYEARILSVLDMQPNVSPELLATTHDVAALVEAVDAALACGMIPKSSASEGGANKYIEQVRVSDQLRAALARVKGVM